MSPDELVYLGILAASIPVGFLFRYLSKYFGKYIIIVISFYIYICLIKTINEDLFKIIFGQKV